ncbi:MAG TPA: phosphotransferase [Burkholderiales bacterium]|nr:phosphotransferase [Burkholderiales bacterium]
MDRRAQLEQWLHGFYPADSFTLSPASADASFRRYFRLSFVDGASGPHSLIAMDAPPEQENCAPFIKVAGLLKSAGLNAPVILQKDLEQGFLLLSDLGTQTYLNVINEQNADELFVAAIDALIVWQLASKPEVLPPYDAALLSRELNLFPDWYIAKHRRATLNASQQNALERSFALIMASNLAQPKVYVHRDFMPRNLMISSPNPGILDFQDAVYGPITYDLLSLFKDAFISWEEQRVLDWVVRYWEKARAAGLPVKEDFSEFYRDFEWMGLQRHLKVAGIFARLCYRDGKQNYLDDVPRFLTYIRNTCARYDAMKPLLHLLDELEQSHPQVGYTF